MSTSNIGNNIIGGLSSDIKPTNYATNTIFIESNTGAIYRWTGADWVQISPGLHLIDEFKETVIINKNAESTTIATGEVIQEWKVGDDPNSVLRISNLSDFDEEFIPLIQAVQNTTADKEALSINAQIGDELDTTSVPALTINVSKDDLTAIENRPLLEIQNATTPLLRITSTQFNFLSKQIVSAVFPNEQLQLRSPANNTSYFVQTGEILVDRNIILPVLTDNDTLLFENQSQTLANKTIVASDNIITDTSIAAGDILKGNGTKFIRMGMGTALQYLRVNSGGTDLEYASVENLLADTFLQLDPIADPIAPSGDSRLLYVDDSTNHLFLKLPNNTTIDIEAIATASGEANTAANVGVGGTGIFKEKSGVELRFKNISEGASGTITITDDVTNSEIDIDVNASNLLLSNLGGTLEDTQLPANVVLNDQNNDLGTFYFDIGGISAPDNPSVGVRRVFVDETNGHLSVRTSAGTTVSLEAGEGGGGGGESNTASNIGIGGVGIFVSKDNIDLQFKNINSGSDKITVTDDTDNNEIDIDVDEAELDIANIGGTVLVSQLPASVVRNDQTNIFGDFDQTFTNNRLAVNNSTATFKHFIGSAATADRTVTLPNATGIIILDTAIQTLVSKTIDASLNTLTNIGNNAIAAHTTTKITTTNKSLLNADIMYEDEDNIVGAHYLEFDKISIPGTPNINKVKLFFDTNTQQMSVRKDTGDVVSLEAGVEGAIPVLNDVGDVVITDVEDNQVLTWDSGIERWVNQVPIELGLDVVRINQQNIYEEFDQVFWSSRLKISNPANTASYSIAAGEITEDLTLNLPLITTADTIMTTGTSQTITGGKIFATNLTEFDNTILSVRNPDTTFNYIFNSSAITGNRNITLPLLEDNDIFVFEGLAQSLTNKTIDASFNTISNIADANIATHTTTKITTTNKSLLNTAIFYKDEDSDIGDHYIEIGDISTPSNPSAGKVRLFFDTSTSELSVRKSGGTTVSLEGAGGGGASELDDLTDVVLTTPALDEVLTFDGTNWVNAAPGGGGGGEANTASNVGTAGVGLFKTKVGADLRFKKINAGSTKITITDDTGSDEVDVDVAQANLDLESIGGSITTRSKIPSPVVYDDEANTYGDFNQIFRSSRLILRDSDNTHSYIIAGSNLAANRTITLPLLGGNDTLVTEAFTQTLTNKTINASSNTITNLADAAIAAHTTTKITTTNKSLLNSSIAYIDQQNAFGNFLQFFRSGKLCLTNPANTFSYILTGAELNGNRILNFPLLTTNDTLVTEAFAQTLTNKTIDTSANTISNIGDSHIAAAGITTRSKLPSPIAYEDEANTYGDLDQKFRSGRLKIRNPADTFNYSIVGSAITADRNVTIPLLSGNDIFACAGFANTFTAEQTIQLDDLDAFDIYRPNSTVGAQVGIALYHRNSSLTKTRMGLIRSFLEDNSVGAHRSRLDFWISNAGGLLDGFRVTADGTIIVSQNNAFTTAAELSPAGLTALRTFTFPNLSGVLLTDNATQTVTNKTISGADNTITNVPATALPTSVKQYPFVLSDSFPSSSVNANFFAAPFGPGKYSSGSNVSTMTTSYKLVITRFRVSVQDNTKNATTTFSFVDDGVDVTGTVLNINASTNGKFDSGAISQTVLAGSLISFRSDSSASASGNITYYLEAHGYYDMA